MYVIHLASALKHSELYEHAQESCLVLFDASNPTFGELSEVFFEQTDDITFYPLTNSHVLLFMACKIAKS